MASSESLILHIGANKTGSTAIQEFLRMNARRLARHHGVVVAPSDLIAGSAITGQHVPVIEELRRNEADGRRIAAERISALMGDLPAGGKLLISAENLSNPNGEHMLLAEAVAQHNTRVIIYIRRQDELLLSSWQQWGSKKSADFWAWIVLELGLRGDWRATLECWEHLVPSEQITVRIYDRSRLYQNNLIADFLFALGISEDASIFRMPAAAINPSYSEAVLDFVKGNTLLFRNLHDNAVYEMIEALTGDKFHRDPRESIITHQQRHALLYRYRPINAWVKNRYFPDSKESLFPEPRPRDYDVIDAEELAERKWQLTASLIFGLAQRVMK